MEAHYTLRPIGRIESPLTDPATAPKQGHEGGPEAWLVLDVDVVVVDGDRVLVHGLEAVDGTPVVDIKPMLGPL